MKIYIDESNINLSKQNKNEKFFISAAAVFHNEKLIHAVYDLKEKYGITGEIKGSDLMTFKNTKIRKDILKNIFPLISGTIFIWDYYLEKSLDITSEWGIPQENMLDRFLLSSDMAETCREELFEMQSKNKKSINGTDFFKKITDKITLNERDFPGFRRTSSLLLKEIEGNLPINWISRVDSNPYKILCALVLNVFEITSGKDELEFDNIQDKKIQIMIKEVVEAVSILYNTQAKTSLKFVESSSSIGIQVADWVASIARKTVHNLITKWYRYDFQVGKFISNIDIEYGNELLYIWRSLWQTSKELINIQLTYDEKAFLLWAKENDDITKILEDDFIEIIEEYIQKSIFKDVGNLF